MCLDRETHLTCDAAGHTYVQPSGRVNAMMIVLKSVPVDLAKEAILSQLVVPEAKKTLILIRSFFDLLTWSISQARWIRWMSEVFQQLKHIQVLLCQVFQGWSHVFHCSLGWSRDSLFCSKGGPWDDLGMGGQRWNRKK